MTLNTLAAAWQTPHNETKIGFKYSCPTILSLESNIIIRMILIEAQIRSTFASCLKLKIYCQTTFALLLNFKTSLSYCYSILKRFAVSLLLERSWENEIITSRTVLIRLKLFLIYFHLRFFAYGTLGLTKSTLAKKTILSVK
jgi:hypothetical protein